MRYSIILIVIYFLFSINLIANDNLNDSIIYRDTILINKNYILTEWENRLSCLTNISGDTIVPIDRHSSIELLDINEDGYSDIRVYYFTNMPNWCDNYLFDIKSQTYRLINCNIDIKKVKGTNNYYYSYYANGGAGQIFRSDFYVLLDFKLEEKGYIQENKSDKVVIYKISPADNKKMIEEIKFDNYLGAEDYWILNYKTILK